MDEEQKKRLLELLMKAKSAGESVPSLPDIPMEKGGKLVQQIPSMGAQDKAMIERMLGSEALKGGGTSPSIATPDQEARMLKKAEMPKSMKRRLMLQQLSKKAAPLAKGAAKGLGLAGLLMQESAMAPEIEGDTPEDRAIAGFEALRKARGEEAAMEDLKANPALRELIQRRLGDR